ncbi:NAD(P)-dependent oxidoreductase [Mucilaginibacter sp. CAU 1740]|uniref:NAD-dependent epimerase/dehydratase family protein n=1 Tax=Mucilaginibacter sp. CAU 1740 TaxID=3140365 RepID=UPI00325AA26C
MDQKTSRRDFLYLSGKSAVFAGALALAPGFVKGAGANNTLGKGDRKKIMITGHLGYVGSRLIKAFGNEYDIVGYDILEGNDILNPQQLEASMKGCEIVVHLAAIPKPTEGKTYQDYFRTNVEGSFNVAQAALKTGVRRLVYASSTTYYGIEGGIPFHYPVTENQQVVSQYLKAEELHCRDIDLSYHTSKVMAEQIMAWHGLNKKMETIALRYGPIDKVVMGVSVSSANVTQATKLAIDSNKQFWYEGFTIVDDIDFMDTRKAKKVLGYRPVKSAYRPDQTLSTFKDRTKLG